MLNIKTKIETSLWLNLRNQLANEIRRNHGVQKIKNDMSKYTDILSIYHWERLKYGVEIPILNKCHDIKYIIRGTLRHDIDMKTDS